MSRNLWCATIINYALVGAIVNLGFRDRLGFFVCAGVAVGAFMLYDDVKVVRRSKEEIDFE